MDGLKFSRYAYALYIKTSRFILYFETFEDAQKFAEKHYPNVEAHVEPISIHNFTEKIA